MDKTSRIGVFACALLMLALELAMQHYYPAPPPKPHAVAPSANNPATATVSSALASASAPAPASVSNGAPREPETVAKLENEAVSVSLSSIGGAIKEIDLKRHADLDGPVILNVDSANKIMELHGWPVADGTTSSQLPFRVEESTSDRVIFSADLPNGLKWQRIYRFGENGKSEEGLSGFLRRSFVKLEHHLGEKSKSDQSYHVYAVRVEDQVSNTGASDVTLPDYVISLGQTTPLLVKKHYQSISNQYLGSAWYSQHLALTTINDFNPGTFPFLGFKTHDGKDIITSEDRGKGTPTWLAVQNQFFTVLLTPDKEHPMRSAISRCQNKRDEEGFVFGTRASEGHDEEGYLLPQFAPRIESAAAFPALTVPAGQTLRLGYNLYTGPKDFNRLDALGDNQGELMNYDGVFPFSLLIVPMLTVLKFWYLLFHSYGVAIILLTLMIKGITWPLQSIANRSGKRMQALAPMLKEIQEQYKDKPEKLQTETFALYRDYGVNPFGGCLPALVQMPVFFSLYFMLQNAVEIRGQSFLWIHDLTQPDSIVTFTLPFILPWIGGHLALNLLPIGVTGLTMVMMRMTPQIGDPQQAKIAQWMPLIFLFIFYNFAAALSLYYVINNAVSIIQIYRNLKKPLPVLKRVQRKK